MKLELAVADSKDWLCSWELEDKTDRETENSKILWSQPLSKTLSFEKTKLDGHASERCRYVLRPPKNLLGHAVCIPKAINWSLLTLLTLIKSLVTLRTVKGKIKRARERGWFWSLDDNHVLYMVLYTLTSLPMMLRPGTQALVVSRAVKIYISALFASSLVRNNISYEAMMTSWTFNFLP